MKQKITMTQHKMKKYTEAEARRIVKLWTIMGVFTKAQDGGIIVTLVQVGQVPIIQEYKDIERALNAAVGALWGKAWNTCTEIEREKR